MLKKFIQLEPDDWESYINETRASLDTTRATEALTTSGDLAADKRKTSTQTQTSTGKIDQEKKMEITPTTRPFKCATKKSHSKTKDRRSPIRPPNLADISPNKKTLKDKQKSTSKQKIHETENIESSKKSRLLEKMDIENNPQLTKHKGHQNKRAKSPDLRLNNEPQNNSVELPRDQSQYE